MGPVWENKFVFLLCLALAASASVCRPVTSLVGFGINKWIIIRTYNKKRNLQWQGKWMNLTEEWSTCLSTFYTTIHWELLLLSSLAWWRVFRILSKTTEKQMKTHLHTEMYRGMNVVATEFLLLHLVSLLWCLFLSSKLFQIGKANSAALLLFFFYYWCPCRDERWEVFPKWILGQRWSDERWAVANIQSCIWNWGRCFEWSSRVTRIQLSLSKGRE